VGVLIVPTDSDLDTLDEIVSIEGHGERCLDTLLGRARPGSIAATGDPV
jgi:hypothetical protein